MAEIRPQPQSPALGALARMLGAARDAAGRVRIDSQLLGQTSLADLLSLPGAAGLAEDVSYFGPAAMLRPGSGRTLQTFKLDPRVLDAADVALNVSPLGVLAARGAARAARPVARAAGEAVNRAMLTGEGPLATALAPVAPKQLIVYHGTPHRFERFDASKIGTGEGAQAYGHGLYFAESPRVADEYASKLSNKFVKIAGVTPSSEEKNILDSLSVTANTTAYGNQRSAVFDTLNSIARHGTGERQKAAQGLLDKSGFLGGKIEIYDSGSLYTVDLPDEAIARMLDWDKPLSEQPDFVKQAIDKSEFALRDMAYDITGKSDPTGGDIARTAMKAPEFAKHMRDLGIPGIRYFDAGSRDIGTGTSNFVVFPGAEDMLTILERKAKGGPVRRYADGGAVNAAQYDPADIARRAATLMEEFDARLA